MGKRDSWITSQFDTAPKQAGYPDLIKGVGLPVSSTLLQNRSGRPGAAPGLDYQSVRHCSKTVSAVPDKTEQLDYQSVRHCSKTYIDDTYGLTGWITSQFDTAPKQPALL